MPKGISGQAVEEIMTPAEVAAFLRIHVKTVYKLAEEGRIPGKRIGRSWRFRRSSVIKLVSQEDGGEERDAITEVHKRHGR